MENLILMIDQFIDKSRKLKVNLENSDYKVIITKDISEAQIMINSNQVGLIMVFDIEMDFDILKTNINFVDIPILGVLEESVKSKNNIYSEILDDYIFSPYEKEQLYLKIKNLLTIRDLRNQLKQKDIELKNANERLNNFELIDKVTGLYNSFYFSHMLQNQCASAKRFGYKLSGIIISIDNKLDDLEKYNDALKKIASTLSHNVRTNDVLVRLNADEFYILLPHTSLKDAMFVAEKLRKQIETLKIGGGKGITISCGVTSLGQLDKGVSKEEELIVQAREALKDAVRQGGNQSKCY